MTASTRNETAGEASTEAGDRGDQANDLPGARPSWIPVSPCHGKRCRGGPARVWCPDCGRSFQADDIALTASEPGRAA